MDLFYITNIYSENVKKVNKSIWARLESKGLIKLQNREVKSVDKLKKIIANITWIFVLVCAISYLISSYRVYKGKEVIPNILGFYGFKISTGSMEPAINTGDYLVSTKVTGDTVKVNDIITFIDEDTIITHRVSDIIVSEDGEKEFITKGDANNTEDDVAVISENIISKYVFKIPKLGYILDYFKYMNLVSKIGILLPICLVYLYIGKSEKINIKREEKNEEIW